MEENENVSKNEEKCVEKKPDCGKSKGRGAPSGAVYGLGFIGAAIYYLSVATGFWMGVLGILKAIIWPVLLVYESLKFLAK
ncbi:MAG: hypothetical protein WC677_01765 [Clostridia bacterium]